MAGRNEKVSYRLGLSCQMGLRRTNNEDNYYLNGRFKAMETADEPTLLTDRGTEWTLVAVCDGLGGQALGEQAAWKAVSTLQGWEERLRKGKTLEVCVREINRAVVEEGERLGKNIGATMVLAVLRKGWVEIANVGDSRAYLYSGHTLRQLTPDHTVAGQLLRIGISLQKDDSKHHQLTQYLGIREEDMVLEPYCQRVPLGPGDRLLLCSDGLTDIVEDGEIARILAGEQSPEEQALLLGQAAERGGGWDNVTVLVATLD